MAYIHKSISNITYLKGTSISPPKPAFTLVHPISAWCHPSASCSGQTLKGTLDPTSQPWMPPPNQILELLTSYPCQTTVISSCYSLFALVPASTLQAPYPAAYVPTSTSSPAQNLPVASVSGRTQSRPTTARSLTTPSAAQPRGT